jgi:hypothetical protein
MALSGSEPEVTSSQTCTSCLESKSIFSFYTKGKRKSRDPFCKTCRLKQKKKKRIQMKKKIRSISSITKITSSEIIGVIESDRFNEIASALGFVLSGVKE